jgi:UDP-N-acetylmuramoyl-tripeptide--D-alanyl-D-alanine ligase
MNLFFGGVRLKALNLQEIIKAIDGKLVKGSKDIIIKGAVRYFNNIRHNTLYLNIYSEKIINTSLLKKYKSVVIMTDKIAKFEAIDAEFTLIQVNDIAEAYWKFIEYYRSLLDIPIMAVTGTCGKTTTREMIKHILSKKYNVKATINNRNSIRRNFVYLLGINDKTQAAVFETPVNSPGNLAFTCRHFKPQIRILLNIGTYHLLGCKTPEAYIKAKAEILEGITPNDLLILNADDENIKKIDISNVKRIMYFGIDNKADFQATNIKTDIKGVNFTFSFSGSFYEGYLNMLGKHNVYNALAAIAAVNSIGIDIDEACELLRTYKPFRRHLHLYTGEGGCTIIDDSWNNTPPSMAAALNVLKELANGRRKIAVLNYMYNLGTSEYAQEQYAEMGRKVVETGVDILIIVGVKPKVIGTKAIELGMDKNNVYFVKDKHEIYKYIKPYLDENSIILLKVAYEIIKF